MKGQIKKIMTLKKIFILCVALIILYKIIILLDTLPPIVSYGNIIYHITEAILYILNQFAIGVSGAIIFYYLNLFFNTKVNMELQYDMRTNLLFMLYDHMQILKNIDYFKKLGDKALFGYKDCDVLFNIIDNSSKVEDGYVFDKDTEFVSDYKIEYKYEQAIGEYFQQANASKLIESINGFNIRIKDFRKCISDCNNKYISYQLKGFKDIVDTVSSEFYCDDLMGYTDNLIESKFIKKEDIPYYRRCLCLFYLQFLSENIEFYNTINEFIEAVENNNIVKYLNMVY